ncbi:MAG: hypothetical protein QW051_02720 [Candidatus Aenigmatarchaeota archaeon]
MLFFRINPEINNKDAKLLVPIYRKDDKYLAEKQDLAKFELHQEEFVVLKNFVDSTDNRVLLVITETSPANICLLRNTLKEPDSFYKFGDRRHGNFKRLIRNVIDRWSIKTEYAEGFKELEDEICHFRHISVSLEDINELRVKIDKVCNYPNLAYELNSLYGKISPEEFLKRSKEINSSEEFSFNHVKVSIRYIAEHYYLPVVLSENDKASYIRHVIKTLSGVRFIEDLKRYLSEPDNKFRNFDWWFFSKLDESLDEVYIPYYDPKKNRISKFKPDFIFWLKKDDRYFVVFVDPKGTEHADWQRKVLGYISVFMDKDSPKVFYWNDLKVTVHLFLKTDNLAQVNVFKEFWFENINNFFNSLLTYL